MYKGYNFLLRHRDAIKWEDEIGELRGGEAGNNMEWFGKEKKR